jgi:prepilin-type N-terminal cleavage/methylation domain-containing protein
MRQRRSGFTIVEVLIAIVMLSVGLLVLAGGAGGVTRMLVHAERKTRSFAVASSLMDSLRNVAKGSCTALAASGSGTNPGGLAKSWTVTNAGTTGASHVVTIIMAYQVGTRPLRDTLVSTIYC